MLFIDVDVVTLDLDQSIDGVRRDSSVVVKLGGHVRHHLIWSQGNTPQRSNLWIQGLILRESK